MCVTGSRRQRVRQAIAYALNRRRSQGRRRIDDLARHPGDAAEGARLRERHRLHLRSGQGQAADAAAGYANGFTCRWWPNRSSIPTPRSRRRSPRAGRHRDQDAVDGVSTGIGQFATRPERQLRNGDVPWCRADMYQVANQLPSPGHLQSAGPPGNTAGVPRPWRRPTGPAVRRRLALYQKADRILDAFASGFPGCVQLSPNYVSPKLEGVTESFTNPNPMPVGPTRRCPGS